MVKLMLNWGESWVCGGLSAYQKMDKPYSFDRQEITRIYWSKGLNSFTPSLSELMIRVHQPLEPL